MEQYTNHNDLALEVNGATKIFGGVTVLDHVNFTNSTMANGAELSCIVAGVVGGTSMNGGSGSIWGTLVGSLLMGVINNGLNLLNVSQFWQDVAMGALVILAVAIDCFRQASKSRVKRVV